MKLATGITKTFSNVIIDTCHKFDKVFLEILNKHAPSKRKLLGGNRALYVSKAMRKDTMKRSSLEKKVLKKNPKNLEEITRNKTKKLVGFLKTKERNFLAA